jgi:multimeric flavodoxin WrbA
LAHKSLLVIGHVPSENTRALRDAVVEGACADGIDDVDVRALSPFDTGPDDVLAADAVILGTTENLGYMSGALKDFFDRTYYGVLEEKQGLPYALYVRAGLDGTGTMRAVDSITTGLRWKPICDPLLCKGDWDENFVAQARDLGQLMAAGLEAGVF